MPKRKKGQRFKGTHWWEKKRSSGEDDNPVASTASERKLLADDDSDSEYERDLPQTCEETAPEDPGYRLVHLSSMKQAFEKNHHCQDAQMILVEDEGKRFGQSSVFSVQCSKCKMETPLQTSKTTGSSWNPRDATDINRRVVYAASETGIGREGMATMCDILNMPQPISTKAWHDHNNALYAAHKTVIEKHLKSTRDRLYRTLTKNSPSTTEEEVIDVAVTFDGTWSKRGHTANYGFCFAIAVETGQVLDYGFKSKICWECNSKKAKADDVEFQEWYESHKNNCSKNYDGSSGNMEVEIAKELWQRSKDFKMRYKYMVSDGDSKAYAAVWDTYGCCDTCEKYENMDRQSKDYQEWVNSDAYQEWKTNHEEESAECNRVVKLDCIGHVQKRLGTALRELKKRTKGKLSDGKAIGGRGHRLSVKTIDKLQEYYGKAIRGTVNRDAVSASAINESVKKMMKGIWAVLYHCTIIPNSKDRHKFCPEGETSWCSYKRTGKEVEDKTHYLDHVFLELLKPVFRRLSERSLLLRCLPGYSQNQNESLNGVVWSKAPKHKFKGPKSIEMAGMSAVLQFDCGQRGRQEVMRLAGIPHGNHTEEGGERKDRKRMYGSARKASEVEKKKRVAQRQAKLVREQEAVAREGGPSYASGAFNLDPIVHSQQAKD